MGREHVSHRDIANWAVNTINLPSEKAKKYRAQANGLREKLKNYLNEHPDFVLKRMLISGSLAKGTALKSTSDIDIGCYIKADDAPASIEELLDFLAEKLRKAFPNFSPDQVVPQTYSVQVSFRGTGLDVDIVPILYYDDPDWYGNLVSQDDGSFLKTNIPLHIKFIRARKSKNNTHFAQVIRLAKYWAKNIKSENPDFKFKSFMIELIFAKLADNGQDFSDYPEALQSFFTYIATKDFREQISFNDYYPYSDIGSFSEPVQMIDPVNEENNAAKLYTDAQADLVVDAAIDAGDAIDAALAATTKENTIYYWKKVFGPSFHI
ncbi:nucleotidyltransferase [Kordia sp. YSTF-M3]|uniref:Nucleotidyltransferase n=1 Tax=Kordia aestuariivivens TaxID=2759037 RepID=A0ABR7Q5T5_9FLAO|nr:CBASS oligonucleotide cyclase [Kordia aestuariivivens]MBC8753931.1 nucleotidyltransferase [Kordia aestuariivivens]